MRDSANLASQFHDSPEDPAGSGRWTERVEVGVFRPQLHSVLSQVKPLHGGVFFKERHHDLTGNGLAPPFDDDGVSGQNAGAGHAFPSNPEGEVVREIPGIGDFYREISLRVLDGLFETAGGNLTQEGDRLKPARRPVGDRRRQSFGLAFGQAVAAGPARLLDQTSLFDKSGEMGPNGLDGPETEVLLHFAKGRRVPPQETVAHEAENSIPGLSRRGFGHARSITDICLVCQSEETTKDWRVAACVSPPCGQRCRRALLPGPERAFRLPAVGDAGRRPALRGVPLEGNFVDVVARVHSARFPGVRRLPFRA